MGPGKKRKKGTEGMYVRGEVEEESSGGTVEEGRVEEEQWWRGE